MLQFGVTCSIIATISTTIIFTPSPATTFTATIAVQEVALESDVSVTYITEEHSGVYTQNIALTSTSHATKSNKSHANVILHSILYCLYQCRFLLLFLR
jgi:hypothetical protein